MLVSLSPNESLPQRQPLLKRTVSSANNLHKCQLQLDNRTAQVEHALCGTLDYPASPMDKRGQSPISSAFAYDLQSIYTFSEGDGDIEGLVQVTEDARHKRSRYTLFRQREERRLVSKIDLSTAHDTEHIELGKEQSVVIQPVKLLTAIEPSTREPSMTPGLTGLPALQHLPESPRSSRLSKRMSQDEPLSAATRHARVMRRRSQASDSSQLGRLLQLAVQEGSDTTDVNCPARTSFVIAKDLHERASSCSRTNLVPPNTPVSRDETSHVLAAANCNKPFYSQFAEMISASSVLSQLSASTNAETLDTMLEPVERSHCRKRWKQRKYKWIFAGWC